MRVISAHILQEVIRHKGPSNSLSWSGSAPDLHDVVAAFIKR